MATTRKRRVPLKHRCLNCPRKVWSRGCCIACLHMAHRLIKSGEKTEQELIDAGAILETQRRGRAISTDNPVRRKLEKANGKSK